MLSLCSLVTRLTFRTRGGLVAVLLDSAWETHAWDRQVTVEEATTKATQMSIMFMETSAKAGHNVKSLFKKIAMSLPGMDKDANADANTSMSTLHPKLDSQKLTCPSEIDVTTPANADVPEASNCSC